MPTDVLESETEREQATAGTEDHLRDHLPMDGLTSGTDDGGGGGDDEDGKDRIKTATSLRKQMTSWGYRNFTDAPTAPDKATSGLDEAGKTTLTGFGGHGTWDSRKKKATLEKTVVGDDGLKTRMLGQTFGDTYASTFKDVRLRTGGPDVQENTSVFGTEFGDGVGKGSFTHRQLNATGDRLTNHDEVNLTGGLEDGVASGQVTGTSGKPGALKRGSVGFGSDGSFNALATYKGYGGFATMDEDGFGGGLVLPKDRRIGGSFHTDEHGHTDVSTSVSTGKYGIQQGVGWGDGTLNLETGASVGKFGGSLGGHYTDKTEQSDLDQIDDEGRLVHSEESGWGLSTGGSFKAYEAGGGFSTGSSVVSGWNTPDEWAGWTDAQKKAWVHAQIEAKPKTIADLVVGDMADGESHVFSQDTAWNARAAGTIYFVKLGLSFDGEDAKSVQTTRLGDVLVMNERVREKDGVGGELSLVGLAGGAQDTSWTNNASVSFSFDLDKPEAVAAYETYVSEGLYPGADQVSPGAKKVALQRRALQKLLKKFEKQVLAHGWDLETMATMKSLGDGIYEMTQALNHNLICNNHVGQVMEGVTLNQVDLEHTKTQDTELWLFGLSKTWATEHTKATTHYIDRDGKAQTRRSSKHLESTDGGEKTGSAMIFDTRSEGMAFASANAVTEKGQLQRAEWHNNSNVPIGMTNWLVDKFGGSDGFDSSVEWNATLNPFAAVKSLKDEPYAQQYLLTQASFTGEDLEKIGKHLAKGPKAKSWWKEMQQRQKDHWATLESMQWVLDLSDWQAELLGGDLLPESLDATRLRPLFTAVDSVDKFKALSRTDQAYYVAALGGSTSSTGTAFDTIGVVELIEDAGVKTRFYQQMASALQGEGVDSTEHGDEGSELLRFRDRLKDSKELRSMFDKRVKVEVTDPRVITLSKLPVSELVALGNKHNWEGWVVLPLARAAQKAGGSERVQQVLGQASPGRLTANLHKDRARFQWVLECLGDTALGRSLQDQLREADRLGSDGELTTDDASWALARTEDEAHRSQRGTSSKTDRYALALGRYAADRTADAQLLDVLKTLKRWGRIDRSFKKAGVTGEEMERRFRNANLTNEKKVIALLQGTDFYARYKAAVLKAAGAYVKRNIKRLNKHHYWKTRCAALDIYPQGIMREAGVSQHQVQQGVRAAGG